MEDAARFANGANRNAGARAPAKCTKPTPQLEQAASTTRVDDSKEKRKTSGGPKAEAEKLDFESPKNIIFPRGPAYSVLTSWLNGDQSALTSRHQSELTSQH